MSLTYMLDVPTTCIHSYFSVINVSFKTVLNFFLDIITMSYKSKYMENN